MITIISEKITDKMYILRKMGLKSQNSKISISCEIAFDIFFVIKLLKFLESLWQK